MSARRWIPLCLVLGVAVGATWTSMVDARTLRGRALVGSPSGPHAAAPTMTPRARAARATTGAMFGSYCWSNDGNMYIDPCSGVVFGYPAGTTTRVVTFTATPSVWDYWETDCAVSGVATGCTVDDGAYVWLYGQTDISVSTDFGSGVGNGSVTLTLTDAYLGMSVGFSVYEFYTASGGGGGGTWPVNVTPEHDTINADVGLIGDPFVLTNGTGDTRTMYVSLSCTAGIDPCDHNLMDTLVSISPYTTETIYPSGMFDGTENYATMRLIIREAATPSTWADTGRIVYRKRIRSATVTASPSSATIAPFADTSARFIITNTGTDSMTMELTTTCGSGATGCVVRDTTKRLAASAADTVVVLYTAPGRGASGTVSLQATNVWVNQSATFTATGDAGDGLKPVVTVGNVNPHLSVERDLCVTAGAGSAAAYQCGALRFGHAFPTVRTMNQARTLGLVYSSDLAEPRPVVRADVYLPSTTTAPDSMLVTLTIGGSTRATQGYLGSAWSPGATRRVAVSFDASTDSTGSYPYTLTVQSKYSGSNRTTTVTGTLLIVNWSNSRFGPGWWIAGYERLKAVGDDFLWIGGDGSARLYKKQRTGLWLARGTSRPEVLVANGTNYDRFAEHGARVRFNSTGQHILTINRLGHATKFTHSTSGDTLKSVVVPDTIRGIGYAFTYGNPTGKLSSVVSQGRTVTITSISGADGRIASIRDPNDSSVVFAYVDSKARIKSRRDRRSNMTVYAYDTYQRLARTSVALSASDSLISQYRAAESQGLGATSVPVDSAYTRLTNGRSYATKVWVNRYGAPKTVVNPVGYTTTITYDETWTALSKSLARPNGFTSTATYDRRGNTIRTVDLNPYGNGDSTVTTYTWDARFDFVSTITPALGTASSFAYDGSGNRISQSVDSAIVSFTYNSDGLLVGMQTAFGAAAGKRDSVVYDTVLKNVIRTRSPKGFWTAFTRDSLGRVIRTSAPIDSTDTGWSDSDNRSITSMTYDVMDRITVTKTGALTKVADSALKVDTVIVRNTYDPEGNVTKVERWIKPDTLSVDTIVNSWRFDRANRQVAAIDVAGHVDSTVYDANGNATQKITRRGKVLRMTYDALDRLTQRIVPGDTITAAANGVGEYYGAFAGNFPFLGTTGLGETGYIIRVDTAVFAYDTLGNMTQADNWDARIRRTYNRNGTLATDTSTVRAWNETSFNSYAHKYGLRYTYDKMGRRARLYYPDTVNVSTGAYASYTYDGRGNLATITDPQGNVVSRTYDKDNRLSLITLPGGIKQSYTYDLDNRVIQEQITNVPTTGLSPSKAFSSSTIRNATFQYDARGKLLKMRSGSFVFDTLTAIYDHHGQVIRRDYVLRDYYAASMLRRTRTVDSISIDAMGHLRRNAKFINTIDSTPELRDSLMWGDVGPNVRGWQYQAKRGRYYDSNYDASGNEKLPVNGYNYWSPDEKLRAVEIRGTELPSGVSGVDSDTISNSMRLMEYRYDALGRRVAANAQGYRRCTSAMEVLPESIWVNMGQPSQRWIQNPKWCTADTTYGGEGIQASRTTGPHERWVWDANGQVLLEMRYPHSIRRGTHGTEVELSPDSMDNLKDGVILYTHGAGIDRPVSVIRLNMVVDPDGLNNTQWWGSPVAIFPHWNYQGEAVHGSFSNGAAQRCKTTGGGTVCVPIDWARGLAAYRSPMAGIATYWGSLVHGTLDQTGLKYLRNRYYNPESGRFTQEDPIGLAGGLNLYGYANGDPISYSDPFGLWPWPSLNQIANFAAGFGDAVTFGLTNKIRDRIDANGTVDASSGSYVGGSVTGFAAGAALGGAAARGIATAAEATELATTVHGAKRIADASRLGAEAVKDVMANATQRGVQRDGARVFVQAVEGRFNVVVQGERGIITNLRNISEKSLGRLAKNYGWEFP